MRDVIHIDIANDPITSSDFKEHEDPTKFKSVKTGRGLRKKGEVRGMKAESE